MSKYLQRLDKIEKDRHELAKSWEEFGPSSPVTEEALKTAREFAKSLGEGWAIFSRRKGGIMFQNARNLDKAFFIYISRTGKIKRVSVHDV